MGRIDELVSEEFARWEQRGRGWKVWPVPVRPEPPFEEFTGYRVASPQLEVDDSRRPGFFASLFDSIERKIKAAIPRAREQPTEPEPTPGDEPLVAEFVASLPGRLDVSDEVLRAFLSSLDTCAEPTGFELLGNHESTTIQLVTSSRDASALERQLNAFLPGLAFTQTEGRLNEAWNESPGVPFIVDFGLAHEFMLPLQTGHAIDPFVGLVSVLNELQRDEVAVFQVLFQPVENRWPASVWRSVTDENGKALFLNRPHLIPGTKQKLESPLFGVVVRAAAKAETFDRAVDIIRNTAFALRAFTRDDGNRLIPLHNDDYAFEDHETDLTSRQSRRGGMLLNREELLGFVHLPANEVSASRLKRQRTHTKAAPAATLSSGGVFLGHNEHAGRTTLVHLSAEQRVKHTHIIGASGTGKSTLLFNLIRQDIENGEGVAVLDPHGDLVERILGVIPPERIDDVVFLDPTDEEFSIGFNILSAHSDFEKNLIASDLVSVFQRLSTSWGDQLNSVLKNAILAFLESPRGGTLADLRRFLLDAEFRNEFLQTVRDPDVVYYWRKGFPQLGANKSIGPVLTRLDTFLGPKPIRYMVSQSANRLDFANILDTGKIFLAKLSQGHIGKENAFLLGSLLVSKFQQLAMSRQRLSTDQRRDFWLYLDEFQNFITPSMAEILTGARKYRVGLILAHQELHQLQRDAEVASAVLSNPYTRIVFRVGDSDAVALAKGFASFDPKDLQNLATGEAVCRVERSDGDFSLRVSLPQLPDEEQTADTRRRVAESSRAKYATARVEVEAAIIRATPSEESPPPKKKSLPAQKEHPARIAETETPIAAKAPQPQPTTVPSESPLTGKPAERLPPPDAPAVQQSVDPEVPAPRSPDSLPVPPRTSDLQTPSTKGPSAKTSEPELPAISSELRSPGKGAAPPTSSEVPEVQGSLVPEIPASRSPTPASPQNSESSNIPTTSAERSKPTTPPKMGIGGSQHQAIQQRLKREAEVLGFRASIEKAIQGGSVDLLLERDGQSIACEISVTTTIDHEVGNITKCLNAGFERIAVICQQEARLNRIKNAVSSSLGSEASAQVIYYEPDEFLDSLRYLAREAAPAQTLPPEQPAKRLGYTIKRKYTQLADDERRIRETVAIDQIAAAMRAQLR